MPSLQGLQGTHAPALQVVGLLGQHGLGPCPNFAKRIGAGTQAFADHARELNTHFLLLSFALDTQALGLEHQDLTQDWAWGLLTEGGLLWSHLGELVLHVLQHGGAQEMFHLNQIAPIPSFLQGQKKLLQYFVTVASH